MTKITANARLSKVLETPLSVALPRLKKTESLNHTLILRGKRKLMDGKAARPKTVRRFTIL